MRYSYLSVSNRAAMVETKRKGPAMHPASNSSYHNILLWMVLPLRVFMHGVRYIFGHPIPFVVAFGLVGALLFYVSALPGAPGPDGRIVAGEGNPFPGASTLGAL